MHYKVFLGLDLDGGEPIGRRGSAVGLAAVALGRPTATSAEGMTGADQLTVGGEMGGVGGRARTAWRVGRDDDSRRDR